ncbi:hypothetical protein [uncultured Cohaesibacter sp.]|uniref:hypothetical protein n=1 Tax=uncultured Cohaesibacter sp. TaxID=1002546 RepID=UPI0029C6891B|nr:hypothetical protein [uncultured Cohaesibacter sp.]
MLLRLFVDSQFDGPALLQDERLALATVSFWRQSDDRIRANLNALLTAPEQDPGS